MIHEMKKKNSYLIFSSFLFLVTKPQAQNKPSANAATIPEKILTQQIPPTRPAPPPPLKKDNIVMPDITENGDDTSKNETSGVDLLNLNQSSIENRPKPPSVAATKAPSFDLLGSFDSSDVSSAPVPDLIGKMVAFPVFFFFLH